MTTDLAIYKTLVKAAVFNRSEREEPYLFLVFSDGTKMFYSIEETFDGELVNRALNLKFLEVRRR